MVGIGLRICLTLTILRSDKMKKKLSFCDKYQYTILVALFTFVGVVHSFNGLSLVSACSIILSVYFYKYIRSLF
jgi:hypothetical protein